MVGVGWGIIKNNHTVNDDYFFKIWVLGNNNKRQPGYTGCLLLLFDFFRMNNFHHFNAGLTYSFSFQTNALAPNMAASASFNSLNSNLTLF
jgi:hypothetical protein